MTDWLIFGASVAALVWAIRRHYQRTFPADPPRWRAPGLGMSVRDGRITYRKIKR